MRLSFRKSLEIMFERHLGESVLLDDERGADEIGTVLFAGDGEAPVTERPDGALVADEGPIVVLPAVHRASRAHRQVPDGVVLLEPTHDAPAGHPHLAELLGSHAQGCHTISARMTAHSSPRATQ